MPPLFTDTGDLANWTGTFGAGTIANDATHVHSGPNAVKCTTVANAAAAFKDGGVSAAAPTSRFSTYLYLGTLPGADLDLSEGHIGSSAFKLGVYVQSDGTLKLMSGASLLGSGGVLSAAIFTRLTATANITNSTTYTVKLFKDNAEVISVTNGAALEAGTAGRLHVGAIISSTITLWFANTASDADGSNTNFGYPHIASITPNNGPAGTAVTIAGFGFGAVQDGSSVDVGGSPLTVTSWSDTSIEGTIPALGTGAKTVTVTTAAVGISNPITFTVTAAGAAGANVVPVVYIIGRTANVVPVESVGAAGANIVNVKETTTGPNVVEVRETASEVPRVRVFKT